MFLSQLIKDELTESFLVCEVNGEQVSIDYIRIQHDKYFSRMDVSCYPVQTRASKWGDNTELRDDNPTRQQPEYSSQVSNSPVSNGYNNQAKSSLDIIPKIMLAVSPNYENYTKFFPGADLESIKRTFQATTQLGTRGAVKGYNLRNCILAPNPC